MSLSLVSLDMYVCISTAAILSLHITRALCLTDCKRHFCDTQCSSRLYHTMSNQRLHLTRSWARNLGSENQDCVCTYREICTVFMHKPFHFFICKVDAAMGDVSL